MQVNPLKGGEQRRCTWKMTRWEAVMIRRAEGIYTPSKATVRDSRTVRKSGPDVAVAGLVLTKLSPTEWCVVDALQPDNDASRVLGFIQRVGDAYEVTNLVRLRERTYFSSFDRAAASLDPTAVLA